MTAVFSALMEQFPVHPFNRETPVVKLNGWGLRLKIERATPSNCRELAYLINLAGEGIPFFLWEKTAHEEHRSVIDFGAERAARKEGGFSYRNAKVALHDGKIAGMVLAYRQPSPFPAFDPDDYPAIIVPLLELESQVPDSWYINALATYEKQRGKGIGTALLESAEEEGRKYRCRTASLIVSSENNGALELYQGRGYKTISSRAVIEIEGKPWHGSWLLMTKELF